MDVFARSNPRDAVFGARSSPIVENMRLSTRPRKSARSTVTLLVATTNSGKLREIRQLLADLPVELVGLDRMPPISAPEEVGRTFAENARAKALYYAGHTDYLTIAEDSGLEVAALGGAPGVHSARYGGH